MSNYSDDPAMVRVDFWKQSGKWYDTMAVKWVGNGFSDDAGLIHDQFKRSLRAAIGTNLSEMDATCLEPYHKQSHPICIRKGGWNNRECDCKFENDHSNAVIVCEECSKLPCHNKNKVCSHDNFREERIMDFSFLICNDCGHQWKA